jgi:hypothetical protein
VEPEAGADLDVVVGTMLEGGKIVDVFGGRVVVGGGAVVVDTTVKLPVVYTIPPLLVAVFSDGSVSTSVYATLVLSVIGWYTVALVVGGSYVLVIV